MFRIGKLVFVGGASGQNCETTAPESAIRPASSAWSAGYVWRSPVPTTAMVRPESPSAVSCAQTVDSVGEPADDRVPGLDKSFGDLPRGVEAACRRLARADDGDRALVRREQRSAGEEERRPIVDRAEVDRVVVVEHGDERHPLRFPRVDLVRDRVEVDDVLVTLGGEEGERLVLVRIDVAALEDR